VGYIQLVFDTIKKNARLKIYTLIRDRFAFPGLTFKPILYTLSKHNVLLNI